jgi:hypothetical protein
MISYFKNKLAWKSAHKIRKSYLFKRLKEFDLLRRLRKAELYKYEYMLNNNKIENVVTSQFNKNKGVKSKLECRSLAIKQLVEHIKKLKIDLMCAERAYTIQKDVMRM